MNTFSRAFFLTLLVYLLRIMRKTKLVRFFIEKILNLIWSK